MVQERYSGNDYSGRPPQQEARYMPDVPNGRELAEIIRTLARVDANLETVKANQEKQDKRISWLESKVNWAAGALAFATFALTLGIDFIKSMFKA